MKVIKLFFSHLRADYKQASPYGKRLRRKTYKIMIGHIFTYIWSIITAPIIYPIWYILRHKVTEKCYKYTTPAAVESHMKNIQLIPFVKELMIVNGGWFYYWLWTYGDLINPITDGGLPERYGKPTFAHRYKYSAIRNPRFNINHIKFRTRIIVSTLTVIDSRDYDVMTQSDGVGDTPQGIYFKWMSSAEGDRYFIYENNSIACTFYFGYTGLLTDDIGNSGRFEIRYNKHKN